MASVGEPLWPVSSAAAGSPGCRGRRTRAWAEEQLTHRPPPAKQLFTGGRWGKTSSCKPGETDAKEGVSLHHAARVAGLSHLHNTSR